MLRRDDLYAPGLFGLGFPAERLIQVCARDEAEALAVMEDALGTPGVAAVIGEVEAVDLIAGRRLQLACEQGGATGFLIRRRPVRRRPDREATGSAAATRWRIASAPSEAGRRASRPGRAALAGRAGALPGRAHGAAGSWKPWRRDDGAHPLRLVAELGDRQLAPAQPLRLAG